MVTPTAGLLAVTILATPVRAQAADFAKPGQFVVGAERLMGLYSDRVTTEGPGPIAGGVQNQKNTTHITSLALLGAATGRNGPGTPGGGDESQPMPASTPRLSLDVFVISGLSVGGSFMYSNRSGSGEQEVTSADGTTTTTTEDDLNTLSTLLFAPRVGYALSLMSFLAVWPRLGVTHTVYSESGTVPAMMGSADESSNTSTFTELTLEGLLVITPVSHVGITAGPYLELPLGASYSEELNGDDVTDGDGQDISYTSFGLWAGLCAYF